MNNEKDKNKQEQNITQENIDTENEKTVEITEEKTSDSKLEETVQENKSENPNGSNGVEDIIKKLEAEVGESKDRLLRKAAEFENYKKRTETEISEIIKYSAKDFILEILAVYDDFQRSLDHVKDAKDITAIKSGMELVFEKFSKALKNQGVKKMESKGKEFDFNYHDALMQQPSAEVPPDTVLEEVEPGYLYKDKVIKHAKVIVSQEVEKNEEKQNG